MNSGAAIMGSETYLGFFFARSNDESAAKQSSPKFLQENCRMDCSSYRAGRSEMDRITRTFA
jgi:hypothetical protein